MSESERRRRRPAISCVACRRRKIRCNRETPCSNCAKSRSEVCVYDQFPPLQPEHQQPVLAPSSRVPHGWATSERTSTTSSVSLLPNRPSVSIGASPTAASTPATDYSTRDADMMKEKIRQLEDQLSKTTHSASTLPHVQTSRSTIETAMTSIGGTFHLHHDKRPLDHVPIISRSVMHKTRLFGQSHWINGAAQFLDVLKIIEPHVPNTSKVASGVHRCKQLARLIKNERTPSWPVSTTSDLPLKPITDQLVDCYLRTIETVYRILHIPTFKRKYEALWTSPSQPDQAFLVQLKLVLALGAVTYDESFSLRTSAIRWVYEAQTWLSSPKFKAHLDMQCLQSSILLLLARELSGAGGELLWISIGSLLRTAMYMGLHRDPVRLPQRSVFAAEMRRRVWNTILELALQSSLCAGGPPLVSLEDFDTQPPNNFDDEQLEDENSIPKPAEQFTNTSCAIALRQTLSVRFAIINFLNNLDPNGTLEETVRLDSNFKATYKIVSQQLRSHVSHENVACPFGAQAVDFIMYRYLLSLHIPFFGRGLHETAYAYSRNLVIEMALKIWRTAYPEPSPMTASAQSRIVGASPYQDNLARLVICGSGFFRLTVFQASCVVAAALRTQLQDEDRLGMVLLRPDLLAVLEKTKSWCLQCIEAGETNIKGYLLTVMIAKHIEALSQGLEEDRLAPLLIDAAEDALEKCLKILEAKAGQTPLDGTATAEQGSISLSSTMPDLMEDWDFMMSDTQFTFDSLEDANWLNNATASEPSVWW